VLSGSFDIRTKEEWDACYKRCEMDINLDSKSNMSVEKVPVSKIMVNYNLENKSLSLAPLHILLGLVNAIYEAIENLNIEGLVEKWLDES